MLSLDTKSAPSPMHLILRSVTREAIEHEGLQKNVQIATRRQSMSKKRTVQYLSLRKQTAMGRYVVFGPTRFKTRHDAESEETEASKSVPDNPHGQFFISFDDSQTQVAVKERLVAQRQIRERNICGKNQKI